MRRRFVSVALSAATAAGLVTAGLTGCSSAPGADASCAGLLQPGALTDHVSVSSSGEAITVTGPTDIANAQRTVLTRGEPGGAAAAPGGIVTAQVSIFDAVTGERMTERSAAPYMVLPEYMESDVHDALATDAAGSLGIDVLIAAALVCATPGDQLAVAATAAQSLASQLSGSPTIAVIDVVDVAPDRAQGSLRGLPAGFPAVTTDADGRPGIVLPPQAAPATVQVAPRILGSGAAVAADSVVVGQVLTVDWTSRSVVSNTWDTGMVSFGTVAEPNPSYDFRELLNGYPAGTQLVVLSPGNGKPVVHVIDIVSAG
ncbi:MAG: hypothetical protein KDB25_02185 [Leucobacter sp.]|nr:hypothetical protein [Leucobacter sp.]